MAGVHGQDGDCSAGRTEYWIETAELVNQNGRWLYKRRVVTSDGGWPPSQPTTKAGYTFFAGPGFEATLREQQVHQGRAPE